MISGGLMFSEACHHKSRQINQLDTKNKPYAGLKGFFLIFGYLVFANNSDFVENIIFRHN